MNILFIAHSPWQLMQSWAEAEEAQPDAASHLVFICDCAAPFPRATVLSKEDGGPFHSITILPGLYGRRLAARRLVVRRGARVIRSLCRERRFDSVFVFNDDRPEAQAALHAVEGMNPASRRVHIEDGSGAYALNRKPKRSMPALVLGRLFYGSYFTDVPVLGTSVFIDEIRAIFPEQLRDELLPKTRTPLRGLEILRDRRAQMMRLFPGLEETSDKLERGTAIIVLAHAEARAGIRGYRELLRRLMGILRARGIPVALKLHPADPPGKSDVAGVSGAVLLPAHLPVESVYYAAGGRIGWIFGDASTALITARRLLDKAEICSFAPILFPGDYRIYEVFARIGVRVVRNADALEDAFCGKTDAEVQNEWK